jgi:hypothetical protein
MFIQPILHVGHDFFILGFVKDLISQPVKKPEGLVFGSDPLIKGLAAYSIGHPIQQSNGEDLLFIH